MGSPRLRGISLWGPVVGFMVTVLLVPGSAVEPLHERVWDKASHAIAFGIFGFFCVRAFVGGLGPVSWRPLASAMILALGFAAFDELRQSWLPDRVGALSDWVADAVGVLSSAAGFAWFGRKSLFGTRSVPGPSDPANTDR